MYKRISDIEKAEKKRYKVAEANNKMESLMYSAMELMENEEYNNFLCANDRKSLKNNIEIIEDYMYSIDKNLT